MYSKEQVTDTLHQVAKEIGETPSSTYWSKHHMKPSIPVIIRLFGSWNNALRAANLELRAVFDYDKESLICKLQEVAQELGHSPTRAYWDRHHIKPTAPTYRKVFGSWNNALKIASLATHRENTSRENVAADILAVAKKLDKTPMFTEYLEHGRFSPPTIYKYLGHWHEAIEKLGLEPAESSPVTREQVLESIRVAITDFNEVPSATVYIQHPESYCLGTVYNFFDTYDDALRALGIEPPRRTAGRNPVYSDEELLDKLIAIAEKVGHTPIHKECIQHGLYPQTLRSHFGTFRNALEIVGLKPLKKTPYDPWTKREILQAIKDFFIEHGRPPTQKDTNCGMPAHQVIVREFGSYRQARKKASVPQPIHIPVRKQRVCKDGHIVQSEGEVKVDDFLFEHNIVHAIQVRVCDERQWTCDFVVKDLWIEVDGFRKGRQGRLLKQFEEKIAYYKKHDYDFLIIHPHLVGWKGILLNRIT